MQKRITIGIILVLVLGGVVGGLFWEKFAHQFGTLASMPQPVPVESVTTTAATEQSWPTTVGAVGTLAAEKGVTLSAELAGTIARIEFDSGAKVDAGALLAQCDVRVEEAQLKSAEARAELANLNLQRMRELRKQQTVSQSDLDSAEAQLKQTNADMAAIQATIEKKTFRAPFAGRLGIRQVNIGQFVNNGNPIVTLESLDPIYIDFALPQQRLADIAVGQEVKVTTDAAPGTSFSGRITAIDPRVDPSTRTLRLRATLDNKDEKLRPGMFASVDVLLPAAAPFVVIPSSSVLYASYGNSVFVVEQQKDSTTGKTQAVARQRTVRLGATRGDFVAVVSGLKSGDEVVSTGAFKLRNDAPVSVQNKYTPPFDLNPKPANT